jgi:hypothetical protein
VRDEIRFGFAPAFYDMRASEVLEARIGFCNTKSTLFVALLRAMGIPARQVFVDIDASILTGLINPGTWFVDHSYTELMLDDEWIALDSYIVDPPLFAGAQARLAREKLQLGYAIHIDGTADWDGATPAFSQFVINGSRPVRTSHEAVMARDVGEFYSANATWNRMNWPMRLVTGFAFARANRKIEALRREAAPRVH